MRLWPVAQSAVGIEMACQTAINASTAAPGLGKSQRLIPRAIRVVAAGHDTAVKGQFLQHRTAGRSGPARNHGRNGRVGGVGWCNEQSRPHPVRVQRMRSPGRHQQATQAVRHQGQRAS